MAIFKALTFDGVNSLDYGIYITGEAVYNAPERAVEMVNIPGKNGALALDQGRFENIEVTYHAGCFADNQADFADKVMKFRNALASRYTYKRLTDEYHPDEYRLGLYKSGLDVDAVRYSTAGEFNIVFDCKPQRFLVSGEEAVAIGEWGETETATGDIVEIDNPDGSLGVKSLTVSLSPIQDLNGYDKPWVGGAGKNKLDASGGSGTVSGVTFTNTNGVIVASGSATATIYMNVGTFTPENGVEYILTGCPSGGAGGKYRITVAGYGYDLGNGYTFTGDGQSHKITCDVYTGYPTSGTTLTFEPMIRLSSESDATWEPYENICPISGHTEVDVVVSPTTDAEDGNTYTTALGRTVYGGTLDVVSGVLKVTHAYLNYNGSENWQADSSRYTIGVSGSYREGYTRIPVTSNEGAFTTGSSVGTIFLSNTRLYYYPPTSVTSLAEFKAWLGSNNLQVVYPLATPQTYQLTPQQIDLLLGTNHLWSDGEITVEYGVRPCYNPTPFASKPLIKVTGTGTLGIGEYILTITGTASQTLYIDCETMEIYALEGTVPTGASSLVSINKNDFPVLEPGTNNISVGSGITAVTITPRWWRI